MENKVSLSHIWRYITDPFYRYWVNDTDYDEEMRKKAQMMMDIERMDLYYKMHPPKSNQ